MKVKEFKEVLMGGAIYIFTPDDCCIYKSIEDAISAFGESNVKYTEPDWRNKPNSIDVYYDIFVD